MLLDVTGHGAKHSKDCRRRSSHKAGFSPVLEARPGVKRARRKQEITFHLHSTNLVLLEDLENSGWTRKLTDSDLSALHTVAGWIKTFVARPNKDLGRAGPVCPFVPGALERKTLWLAPEHIANRSVRDVVQLMNDYKQLLLRAQPIDGNEVNYKAIVVVFTDLSADRAKEYIDDVQIQQLKRPSYVEGGVVLGEFHERNEGSAIYNRSFQPFKAPVPFLLMRHAVISDWKFFLDNDDWLSVRARRFGESAVQALAEELRHTNWRRLES
jgi:hypothetical protein